MSIVNLLCTYYLHGLDGAENDFLNIKTKVEETFNVLFNISKENNNVVNLHYGYCSKDNERKKSHAEFGKLVEISFKELNKFLEDIVLDNFKENTKEKINVDQVQCHVYFSIVGHSLGGLILKGVVKSIFSKFEKDEIQYENYFEYLKQKYSFIHDIQPCSFITLSSPHLGTMTSHESGGISKRFMKFGSKFFCRYLSGPIGKIFMYEDATKDHEKPILIQLCEKEYMTTYEKFPNRTLVACIRHDIPVKYSSAMGDLEMPLYEYQEKHLLIEKDQADTKILSYSGYESEALKYYQKELFNEVISKDMYVSDTLYLPLPNIDEQIKKGLEKLNLKENVDSIKESYGKYIYIHNIYKNIIFEKKLIMNSYKII